MNKTEGGYLPEDPVTFFPSRILAASCRLEFQIVIVSRRRFFIISVSEITAWQIRFTPLFIKPQIARLPHVTDSVSMSNFLCPMSIISILVCFLVLQISADSCCNH